MHARPSRLDPNTWQRDKPPGGHFPKLWLMGVRDGTWLHKVWFVMKVPVGSWFVPYGLELPYCILSVIQMPVCWLFVYTPLLTPPAFSLET